MDVETAEEFRSAHAQAISRLYTRGRAAEFALEEADVCRALYLAARAWSNGAGPDAIDHHLDNLHAEDFVLALACARGNETAWHRFIDAYRPILYKAARALTHDEARAREIADSLWAELYGMEARAGERRSLLSYFGGRSSLATWMRAVLAQRFIDQARVAGRIRPLENHLLEEVSDGTPQDPDRARYLSALNAALVAALGALEPRDRLRLSYYYRESLTLREIARLLREHPSSVSRRMQQTRVELKNEVERRLRSEQNLSEDQIRLCYDYAAEHWPFDLSRALSDSE
jgi:RNA polymerase sigma-70 factor